MSYPELNDFAHNIRQNILDISYRSGTSTHIGGALSMTDVMAVLYGKILKFDVDNPRWSERDRFILSKGHGVLGFYPALLRAGIISREVFDTFQQNGSDLIAHPVMNLDLGIESSNGSLGHGISMAVGIALAAKKQEKSFKTYTLLGDGETNEGSVWEAIMLASHLKLDNLTAIVDYNKQQNDGFGKDVLHIKNMAERFRAFGWHVIEINGHDMNEIVQAFEAAPLEQPKAIIAHTVKGKGVSFMEGNNEWHHNRLTKTSYEAAVVSHDDSNYDRKDHGNNT